MPRACSRWFRSGRSSCRSQPRRCWKTTRPAKFSPSFTGRPNGRSCYRALVDLLNRLRLDVPVAQAGMGGGLAGPELAAAVAAAGGLGTLGLLPPAELRAAFRQVRDTVPDRALVVNLLMPFVRRGHVDVCLQERIDVAVIAFGMDRELLRRLSEQGVFVFVMVGSEEQARQACVCGANGLIAQGCEAGGHIAGKTPAHELLPRVLEVARGRPVLLAGGIAAADDTRAALTAGAAG